MEIVSWHVFDTASLAQDTATDSTEPDAPVRLQRTSPVTTAAPELPNRHLSTSPPQHDDFVSTQLPPRPQAVDVVSYPQSRTTVVGWAACYLHI